MRTAEVLWYESGDRKKRKTGASATAPLPHNERIRTILCEVRGPAILHVGCVNHKLPKTAEEEAHWMHAQLCRFFRRENVLGLDIDAAHVTEMERAGYRVMAGDAQRLEFSQQFDTIVAGELIEHLQNPGLFLEGCARALKPGGRLVLSTPNAFSAMFALMYLKNYDRAFNPEHVMWYCPQTLREMLRRCGFAIEKLLLVDDLAPDVVGSRFYRLFAYGWLAARAVFPRRYRNTIVAVCTLAGKRVEP